MKKHTNQPERRRNSYRQTIRSCREHERIWNSRCVDINFKDEWLEELNNLKAFNLISICEGHIAGRRPFGQSPHINLRIKDNYKEFILKKAKGVNNKLYQLCQECFNSSITHYGTDIKFLTRSARTSATKREDFTIRLRSTVPRKTSGTEKSMIKWFEEIISNIKKFDNKTTKIISQLTDTVNAEGKAKISSEKLAYWYFRLNGFLTITNFVVHPDTGREQRTDVDILGVKFPHRKELLKNPMKDDDCFLNNNNKPYIILAEVKKRKCKLNGPWRNEDNMNMNRVLRAIGSFPEDNISKVAKCMYKCGWYEDNFYRISLFCVGNSKNNDLEREYEMVPQITWDKILKFINNRFKKYKEQKSGHPQWDNTGKILYEIAYETNNVDEYIDKFEIIAG